MVADRHEIDDGNGGARCWLRPALIAFGWLNVGLGAVGIVVPGMPTTVFLLIALWAFSKSSERFRSWLYDHPRLGPPIRAWHAHKVIPPTAKALAVTMMSASVALLALVADGRPLLPVGVGLVLLPVAAFIVTRPGRVPAEAALD